MYSTFISGNAGNLVTFLCRNGAAIHTTVKQAKGGTIPSSECVLMVLQSRKCYRRIRIGGMFLLLEIPNPL